MYFGDALTILIMLFLFNATISSTMRLRLKKKFPQKYDSLVNAGRLAGPFARKGVFSYLLSRDIEDLNDVVLIKQGQVFRWVTLLYSVAFVAMVVCFVIDVVNYNS